MNRRTVEALIKSGAFDKLHDNRSSAFANVSAALSEAERAQANISQDSLFGADSGVHEVPLIHARPWDLLESLAFEKAALGLFLSGHPYEAYRKHLEPVTTMALARVEPSRQQAALGRNRQRSPSHQYKNGAHLFLALDDQTSIDDDSVNSI